MRIFRLIAQNIKALKAIDITPPVDGSAVVIRGKNGAGKSSLLDCVGMAFGCTKLERPIREGQDKGEITATTEDYIITRTFTKKSGAAGYLKVVGKEGAEFRSPQSLLDQLRGKGGARGRIGFDPLEFSMLKDAEQIAMLRRLIPSLDFTKTDADRQKIFDKRTDINRQLRDAKGKLEGRPTPPDGLPEEEVSVAKLAGDLQLLQGQIAAHEEWVREDKDFRDSYEVLVTAIKNLEAERAEINRKIENNKTVMAQVIENGKDHGELKPFLPAPEAVTAAEQAIVDSETTNAAIREAVSLRDDTEAYRFLTAEADGLTAEIKTIDEVKLKAITEAEYPIEGLGIEEGFIVYNGLPFGNLASSEKIRVSTAIGMALNPEFKVFCVHDGSLLDAESLKAIEEQTKGKEFQLWLECVGEGGAGIVIEEGEVKQINT